MVGRKVKAKRFAMMRKTSVILLSAATGAALTLFVTQPRAVCVGFEWACCNLGTPTASSNLFGDVFERVRSDYVEKPDDSKLVESAISGMLAGLDPHSSYMVPRASATCRCRPAENSAGSASRSRWKTV